MKTSQGGDGRGMIAVEVAGRESPAGRAAGLSKKFDALRGRQALSGHRIDPMRIPIALRSGSVDRPLQESEHVRSRGSLACIAPSC
jgi:hypothetical protein